MKYNNRFSSSNKALTLDEVVHKIAHKTNFAPKLYGGGYKLRCPAHEDKNPSLAVMSDDGVILLRCFAGCDFFKICTALNIRPSELFPKKGKGHHA